MIIIISSMLFFGVGCNREIRVQKEMTWECAPEYYMRNYPQAQPVRLRFIENPHYEEVISGQGLCNQLEKSGRTVVIVEFEAWGNRYRGLYGYRAISVDGLKVQDVGGWGSSGANASVKDVGPHPLSRLFK